MNGYIIFILSSKLSVQCLCIRSLVWQMLEREQALVYGDMARSDSIITLTNPEKRREGCGAQCWNYSRSPSQM